MLQIYKQNRALLQALCVSHMAPTPESGSRGSESSTETSSINVDRQLTKEEQKVLREYLKAQKDISATATIEKTRLYDLINKDVRKKVEDMIGTSGIRDIQSKFGLTPDGVYGPGTFKKVVAYQRANGLTVDGLVGPATYAHITGKKLVKTSSKNETGSQATEVAFTGFTRPLYKGVSKGEDVRQLQKLLGIKADGDFGPGTEKALRAYQGPRADGIAGSVTLSKLTGKKVTVRKMTAAEKSGTARASNRSNSDGMSEDGRKLSENFKDVKRYLDAYNRTYGEKGKLFSNKSGIFGIVNQAIGNTNSKALAKELGITEKDLARTASKLGVKVGADYSGVTRFATIAAISLLMSGGAGVAVELFGINTTTNLHRGPNTRAILETLGKQGNLDKQFRKVLLNKGTTVKDLEVAFDHLNDKPMIPANIKRQIMGVYGRDFFTMLGNLRIRGFSKRKEKIEGLLVQFEKTNDLDEGRKIMKEIYSTALIDIRNIRKMSPSAKKRLARLDKMLAQIGIESTTVGHLDAKHDNIKGVKNNAERNRMTAEVEKEIDGLFNAKRSSHKVSKEGLASGQSYSFALPNKLTRGAMKDVFQKMGNSKIEGDKYSILANVMRGVKEHYNIDFSPREFYNGFIKMRRLTADQRADFNKRILSNTGRKLPQTFQGEIKSGKITVMQVNGTNVFFRDACTNIVTVLNDRPTTIQSRDSFPVAIPIAFGGSASTTPTKPNPTNIQESKPVIDIPVGQPNLPTNF